MRRPPSIRVLFGIPLTAAMLLAAGLFSVTILQSRTASERTAAEHARVTAFDLSDQMRQSSNDLTEMVRLYVSTGDPRYRRYYDEILAIRNGTAPRPCDYSSSFWDQVLARPDARICYGRPTSLTTLMRQAGFSGDEFRALDASLTASNTLALLEERVMAAVARVARHPHTSATFLTAVDPEYQQLVDGAYFAQKGRIMGAITSFTNLVTTRAEAREHALGARTTRLLVIQTIILVLLGLVLAATILIAARLIGAPLARLTSVTRRIARGDWSQSAPTAGVAELRHLADNFDAMADAVQRDLDARRRAEQAAESADRAKSAFLAMTSHELRTPLVAVTGTLEVLAAGSLDPDQRQLVEVAAHSAQTLLGVIGDVLDFSKIEAGHLDLNPTATAVAPLCTELVAQMRIAARSDGVAVLGRVDPHVAPWHEVDPVRLRQVLGNLLSNALKFTRQGHVELAVEVLGSAAASQRLAFTVTDTGRGINAADQSRLFAPFEQVGDSGADGRAGTGLGLAICRQLVHAMGGTIALTSEPGRGTTVRVELELVLTVAPPETDHANGGRPGALGRPLPSRDRARREGSLLLLVEDHPVNREILARQLETLGYVTDTAGDAETATATFARESYGLVFTDIQLPDSDGYLLTQRLRGLEADGGRAPVPILALTANALRGARERCVEAGMNDLVVKPATLATLAAALDRWLGDLGAGATDDRDLTADAPAEGVEPALDLDPTVLAELTGGDPDLARDITERYVASLEADLRALVSAQRDGDLGQVRRLAHQIAGASRSVGAHAVAAAAARIERGALDAGESADLERLAGTLTAVE